MRDIDDRIGRWKKRLLDLNKRNRLINFRETKRSNVEITFPTYDTLYKKLVQDEEKLSFSFPLKTTYDENGEEYNIEVQEGDLQTNKTLNEQQKTLKVLRGRAKTSMEEQGINSLYLTFGMLKWKENDISEVVISAPLVLAPVTLTVESITDPYVLQLHEDEIVVNPSLAFKFENNFGITLPEFDGHEDDISEYLSQIVTIAKKNDWQVIPNVHLTLLSFLKINMYKDLDNNKDRIVSNPTIKALCGDTSEIVQIPSELNNFDHDKNVRPIDTYQVVDADSSQQDAILLSKRGISFVLQGPPGTGKSQTITNIISEAISDGKKVLFVSEKMAALEVVKRRLTEAGLDDFCLTLHSYKANKKEILNQLAKTLAVQRISLRQDAIYKLSVLEEKRRKLNEYQEQLHTKCMPLNISIYEANGRLAKLSATQDIIFGINDVEDTDMNLINGYRYLLNEFSKTIGKLSSDYTENPWYGCNVPAVTHELRHDINVNLKSLFLKLGSLSQILEEIIENTGVELTPTINNITTLLNVLNVSSNFPIVPVRWLTEDVGLLRSAAQEYFTLFHERETKIAHLLNRYTEDVLVLAAKDILLRLESHVTEIKGYLNKEYFPTNKDIVIKVSSIITECAELRTFTQSIYSQSKELSSILGSEPSSINLVFQFEALIKLILENPQPTKKWFKKGESIKELIVAAKTKQFLIKNNLTKVTPQFKESILEVDFDSLISRFTNTYNQVLATIRNFNSIADNTHLKFNTIMFFVNEQSEKLKDNYAKVLDAYNTSKKVVNSLGIERVNTLEALISLEELLSRILQNPKPTLAWFDDDKDMAIDKLIVDIKNTQKELSDATDLLLSKYNKDVLNIDYKNMLIRFNTDYRRVFKFVKGSYRTDKKTVLGFSKEPSKKFTDNQIVALLNQICLIKEKEQWLMDNKSLATDLLGTSYLGIYTDWGNIERNRASFKTIRDHFGRNKIPEKFKQLLIRNNFENLMEQKSILSKLVSERIPSFVSNIFGSEVVMQPLDYLLNKIKTTINMSTDIKDDIDFLCSFLIRISSINETSFDDMILILSCVKEVNQNRGWFRTNNDELLECFGAHYKKENTDWDNVAKRFDIIEKIISFFAKEQVPENFVNYLISSVDVSGGFALYSGYIEDIRRRHITERLNDLLSEQDIENIEFSILLELLQAVHDHAHISLDEYVRFSHHSKEQFSFEDTISDIIVLDRIQEIEHTVKKNSDQLQVSFEFMFEEINTDWEKIISALNCVDNLKELYHTYPLSHDYVNSICCDENMSLWAARRGRELSKQQADVKPELEWFVNLFDNALDFCNMNIYSLLDRSEKGLDNIALLEEWIDFRGIRQQCREAGLSEFVEKVEQMKMQPQIIVDTFFKRFYRLWLDVMTPRYPAVYAFRSRSHQSIINEFNSCDTEQLKIARLRILEKLIQRLPNQNIATSSVDEVGVLKRELTKQRKIMPLRRLFKQIPNLLTALKPCLMMSPLSVSLFLQADGYNFDTVIFDEASQVCTEDAVGAIMRGKQVIIAGDSKQLPPTNFFSTSLSDGNFDVEEDDDDEYDDTDAYDSILEEAANAIPERTLKWHYRSRHEHLIAFSNAKIYNYDLVTFPSNVERMPDNGVEYIFVQNGVYDRGGKKNNLNEAKRVGELVFEHIRKYPNRSLGVVTFSEAQQQAIDGAIRQLRLQNGQYENFFVEDSDHAFFIKNLENVQGDERDTIIFSIGYAKDPSGVMYMNFGPLSRNGGYRRLNVAITRAKYNFKLVGSIHPTDIKIETNSEGVKMLRQYIEFAINGDSVLQNELQFRDTVDVDSPFEEAVYDFLVQNGYNAATQVGCSGYRIDMAIKHPTVSGIFVLGIECDGATYHSARTARERDRLRQTVLEDIGWKIYRIWSTDWIKDPKTEGNKLLEAVKMAISNYKMSSLDSGTINHREPAKENSISIKDNYVIVENGKDDNRKENDNPYHFNYYKETDVRTITRVSNYTQYLTKVISYVVEQECPIHFELLCKRVAPLLGNQKATVKVRNLVDNVLSNNLKDVVMKKDDFCWHKNVKEIQVKIPVANGEGRTINYISTEELAEAICVIAKRSFGITKNDLYVVTARVFGFNRTGGNITMAMEKACEYLIEIGRVKNTDGKIIV